MSGKSAVVVFQAMLEEIKADRLNKCEKSIYKYFEKYNMQKSAKRFFDGIENIDITPLFARKLRDEISDYYNYRSKKVLVTISTKDLLFEIKRRGYKAELLEPKLFE